MNVVKPAAPQPRLSVVIATFNREELLIRLLRQLEAQTLSRDAFEVIVVDDGSTPPVQPRLESNEFALALTVIRQANAGAAAARHAGMVRARAELAVIVDDDMQVAPGFLAEHLRRHQGAEARVVLGRIKPDPELHQLPLFERYNASRLERWAAAYRKSPFTLHGNNLCTGNVSFRRADYEAVGGFDRTLARSEDAELGLRLEARGVNFTFSEDAYVLHGSDHRSVDVWMRDAKRYGAHDLRIGRMHPEMVHADPWRYFFSLRPAIRPLLALSVTAPRLADRVVRTAMRTAELLDQVGLESAALNAAGVVYGMSYFGGIRAEAGSLKNALQSAGDYLSKVAASATSESEAPRALAAAANAARDVVRDRETRHGYEQRYGHRDEASASLPTEFVTRIGFQISVGYRLMRMFRSAQLPLAAKFTSRILRHAFGSDIHWDAELEPGVMFVHGFGLAISHGAKVGPGCILSQNVTLGMGIDPVTRKIGAPTLESNVHVGAGATLLGPITVGANSKIMAGVVLTESVPSNSRVEAPAPKVRPRSTLRSESRSFRAEIRE